MVTFLDLFDGHGLQFVLSDVTSELTDVPPKLFQNLCFATSHDDNYLFISSVIKKIIDIIQILYINNNFLLLCILYRE